LALPPLSFLYFITAYEPTSGSGGFPPSHPGRPRELPEVLSGDNLHAAENSQAGSVRTGGENGSIVSRPVSLYGGVTRVARPLKPQALPMKLEEVAPDAPPAGLQVDAGSEHSSQGSSMDVWLFLAQEQLDVPGRKAGNAGNAGNALEEW
jgi:hypothetical protein